LAARAHAPTFRSRNLFHHRFHASKDPPLSRCDPAPGCPAWLADRRKKYDWQLEAWAVFSNHYHFIAHSPTQADDASSLSDMLSVLHVKTAEWINKLDKSPGRQVWFNFRETRLTHQRSYLARLNYVHQNAVKHGLVPIASQYPWCSAAWFERTASTAKVKSIYRFKTDRIAVPDEFDVSADWQP
jgi:putative transposase